MELPFLLLLPALALLAGFRGWGFWPFGLVLLPFAPDLVLSARSGSVMINSAPSMVVVWVAIAVLGYMVVQGRTTP